jgi:hypothetical protein
MTSPTPAAAPAGRPQPAPRALSQMGPCVRCRVQTPRYGPHVSPLCTDCQAWHRSIYGC